MRIEKVRPTCGAQYHSQKYQREKEFWERFRRAVEEQKKNHQQPRACDNVYKRGRGHFDERA